MTAAVLTHSPELDGMSGLLRVSKDALGAFEEARRLHGTFVTYRRFDKETVLLVMEPTLVDELLVRHADRLRKDDYVRALQPILGKGLLTNDGAPWKEQRKLLAPSFQPKHIGRYADVMVQATEELVSTFGAGETRNVHTDMMALALDIVVRTLFGSSTVRTSEVGRLLDIIMDDFRRLGLSFRALFPEWFPWLSRIRFLRMRKKLVSIVGEVIQARKQAPLTDDMLSRLLEAKDDAGRGMSDAQLLDECLTVMLAGHETTALTLMFALEQLTRHPELQAELAREIEEVLGERAATLDDVPRLPLAKAVIKETLRLFPPAWAAGRVALEDFTLGGEPVRAGTQLIVAPWVLHREERYFKGALSFRPERFLNGETDNLPKGAYLPFGAGPRYCIGSHFAELEAVLVLVTLVERLEWQATSPDPLTFAPSITLRPGAPVRLRIQTRERKSAGRAA
jgi:cytochrome P450